MAVGSVALFFKQLSVEDVPYAFTYGDTVVAYTRFFMTGLENSEIPGAAEFVEKSISKYNTVFTHSLTDEIAEKAVWWSVFLCMWYCILDTDSTKTHSSRVTFKRNFVANFSGFLFHQIERKRGCYVYEKKPYGTLILDDFKIQNLKT